MEHRDNLEDLLQVVNMSLTQNYWTVDILLVPKKLLALLLN